MDLTERFLKYVAVYTHSAKDVKKDPTTERQWDLARILVEDLKEIGCADARVDEWCRVYATCPASPGWEDVPAIGFVAHMDTVVDAPGDNIKPRIVHYEGGDIVLSEGIVTSPKDFPFMDKYIGHDLIVTDGTTLLGADDKAGIAEIMDMVQRFQQHPEIGHRKVAICFTPDEEVGRGPLHFDYEGFGAKMGYTVDGGALGGVCYETFNAANGVITIKGFNIHPGSAKNKMKNAVKIAARFITMLPDAESPEHTEGFEGYYHVGDVQASESGAVETRASAFATGSTTAVGASVAVNIANSTASSRTALARAFSSSASFSRWIRSSAGVLWYRAASSRTLRVMSLKPAHFTPPPPVMA